MLKAPDNPNNNSYNNTKQDHRCDGKIKAKVLLFYSYVTRQFPNPIKFVMEEINQGTNDDNDDPYNQKISARVLIHIVQLQRS